MEGFFEKLGPLLTSGIVLALLGGTATALVAWGVHSGATEQRFVAHDAELEWLRKTLEDFRRPGPRFTSEDGARLEHRIERLETDARDCVIFAKDFEKRLLKLEKGK